MNPKVKELWVNALRNGEYKQCRGVLKKSFPGNNFFCCLGVLCDIYIKETGEGYWTGTGGFETEESRTCWSALPGKVVEWAELDFPNPYIGQSNAVGINDDQKKSFSEIADLIEKEL